MGQFAAALTAYEAKRLPSCRIREIADQMDQEDRAALAAALASSRGAERIAILLVEAGYQASEKVVRKHRQRACACYREAHG